MSMSEKGAYEYEPMKRRVKVTCRWYMPSTSAISSSSRSPNSCYTPPHIKIHSKEVRGRRTSGVFILCYPDNLITS